MKALLLVLDFAMLATLAMMAMLLMHGDGVDPYGAGLACLSMCAITAVHIIDGISDAKRG